MKLNKKINQLTEKERAWLLKEFEKCEIITVDKAGIKKKILEAYAIRDRAYKSLDKALATDGKEKNAPLARGFHTFSVGEVLLDEIIKELYGTKINQRRKRD